MSKLALQLIAENKKTRSPYLDLGNCGLTVIPEELGELVWLEELSLSQGWIEFDGEKYTYHTSVNKGEKNQLSSLYSETTEASKVPHVFKNTHQLSPLSSLSGLQTLHASNTKISDLSPLSALS